MTQSIVCGGCGSEVPRGRLSCPECGEMLASVAGAARRQPPAAPVQPAASVSPADRPAPDLPVAGETRTAVAPGQLATWSVPIEDDGPEANDPDAGARDAQGYVPTSASAGTATSVAAVAPVAAPTVAAPNPGAARTPGAAPTAGAAPTPGAYIPPVLQPAGPPAPARAWAGHAGDAALAGSAPGIATTAGPDPASTDAAATTASTAAGFVAWLAIAGSVLAAVGFLLPWSVSVIGADGVGYFDRWGIAGPGHILVVVGLLAVLAAAILRDRVPMWLGIGLPGLGLGALLVGLVWPYLVGPLGAQLGVMAVTVGSLLLAAAGIAAIAVDRHEHGDRLV